MYRDGPSEGSLIAGGFTRRVHPGFERRVFAQAEPSERRKRSDQSWLTALFLIVMTCFPRCLSSNCLPN